VLLVCRDQAHVIGPPIGPDNHGRIEVRLLGLDGQVGKLPGTPNLYEEPRVCQVNVLFSGLQLSRPALDPLRTPEALRRQ
jgi:hypothetical protein